MTAKEDLLAEIKRIHDGLTETITVYERVENPDFDAIQRSFGTTNLTPVGEAQPGTLVRRGVSFDHEEGNVYLVGYTFEYNPCGCNNHHQGNGDVKKLVDANGVLLHPLVDFPFP